MKKAQIIIAVVAIVISLSAYPSFAQQGRPDILMMATTTSTDNTGLLEYLAPAFREDRGLELRWVATGTGKAIALGRNCDVDIVFVHDPDMEKKFVSHGYGVERVPVMFNDFVLVGPPGDPGNLKGAAAVAALEAIAKGGHLFASRGDSSGTHLAEQALWISSTGSVPDRQPWYIQTGQGMINTLIVASERQAYCLTDRGTYITYEARFEGEPPLVILLEGDEALRNQYSVIAVNADKCGNAMLDRAETFIEWIVSPKGQKLIADFTLMGRQLFIPNAGE